MIRDRSARSPRRATLGDALSPQTKIKLHQLRHTLEKRARAAIAIQVSAPLPPWRLKEMGATALGSRNRTGSSESSDKKQTRSEYPRAEQQKLVAQRKPRQQENPESAKRVAEKSMAGAASRAEGKNAERTANKAFKYWDFPTEAAVREPPPTSITNTERSRFESVLGARAGEPTAGGEALFAILGLDFGTSSTKMVVRFPFEAGEPTIAIPAPKAIQSDGHPYLWKTVVWLGEDGTFYPWPEPNTTALNSLKQGLIQGRGQTTISGTGTAVAVNQDQAGVAYLALAIRYANGWLVRNRSSLFRGRTVSWFVNLGMPTASYDDLIIADPYRRIGAAALQLSKFDSPVNVEAAQCFLDDPHVIKAGTSEVDAETLGVAVLPETAAEMTGFAKSTRSAPGLYLLVDVGAMTLDSAMFRLNPSRRKGDNYSFMAAQVRPLGVDALHWFLAEGKTKPQCIQQCEHTLRAVVWNTKQRRDPMAASWQPGNDVPVFLTGGGARNVLHRDIVVSLNSWLRQNVGNEGIRQLELPIPNGIDLPEPLSDFGRMAVAWGLSYQPTEIGRINPMRDIEDIPSLTIAEHSDRFVSKDQV